MDIETVRTIMQGVREAEEIDLRHDFRLPGDSALYIYFWGLECLVGEYDRAMEQATEGTDEEVIPRCAQSVENA